MEIQTAAAAHCSNILSAHVSPRAELSPESGWESLVHDLSEDSKGETCWISLCLDIWRWRGHLPPEFIHTVTLFHHEAPYTCHTFIPTRALTEPESLPQPSSVSSSPVLMTATDQNQDFRYRWSSDLWETLLPLWLTSSTAPPCVDTATLTPFILSRLHLDPLCCTQDS